MLVLKTSYLCGINKPLYGYTIILNSYVVVFTVALGFLAWETRFRGNGWAESLTYSYAGKYFSHSLLGYVYIENEQSFLLQKVIEYMHEIWWFPLCTPHALLCNAKYLISI